MSYRGRNLWVGSGADGAQLLREDDVRFEPFERADIDAELVRSLRLEFQDRLMDF